MSEQKQCKKESGSLKLCETLTDVILNNIDQEFGLKKVNGNGSLDAIVYRTTDSCLISVYYCPFCGGDLRGLIKEG